MCMRFAAVLVGCRKYVVRWGDGIAGCGAKEERLGKRNWQKCLADRNRTSDRWMSAYYSTVHRSTNWATTSSRIPSVGIEPTTLGLLDPRSNQLSHEGSACNTPILQICSTPLSFLTHSHKPWLSQPSQNYWMSFSSPPLIRTHPSKSMPRSRQTIPLQAVTMNNINMALCTCYYVEYV